MSHSEECKLNIAATRLFKFAKIQKEYEEIRYLVLYFCVLELQKETHFGSHRQLKVENVHERTLNMGVLPVTLPTHIQDHFKAS